MPEPTSSIVGKIRVASKLSHLVLSSAAVQIVLIALILPMLVLGPSVLLVLFSQAFIEIQSRFGNPNNTKL
jgi:hypothetical protein